MNRREFLQASAAAGLTLAAGPRAMATDPRVIPGPKASSWLSLLGQGLGDGHDYRPEVTGRIPDSLRGTLYRNGPGLFERNGYGKQHLLDGDGMIQAFDIGPEGARYRNHFVRTPKYLAEEAAGRFLEPTWTTLAPQWHNNLPGYPTESQAGITPVVHHDRLFALDEVGEPFELDPDTLEDRGQRPIVASDAPDSWKAHTKIDGA
ncbi:MAG: carotenoid oxygenase family protein, partial [Pseudomonadota bacterium]|nr:carotenoid oxygenase family protein [Pseudomonadota bacterium]